MLLVSFAFKSVIFVRKNMLGYGNGESVNGLSGNIFRDGASEPGGRKLDIIGHKYLINI